MLDVLFREQWLAASRAHEQRICGFTTPFLNRRHEGRRHPVEDFLFTYYTLSPAQFTRWHPGFGTILLDAPERAGWKFYRPATPAELRVTGAPAGVSGVVLDHEAFIAKRETAIRFTRELLSNTVAKTGTFDCFGLHEWAMAYKAQENGVRHDYLELRLGAEGTNQVVESHRIRCSHFDAFRFFHPQAVDRNELKPSRESQRGMEQPGCLHANMDLYKWAYKLLPAVDSDLLADCFELAWEVRRTDMEASPYELSGWGYEPVRIETPAGKAEYVRRQRDFATRSESLRHRILAVTDRLLADAESSESQAAPRPTDSPVSAGGVSS